MTYTHWLVTKGNPIDCQGKKITPILLLDGNIRLPEIRRLVLAEVEKRAMILLNPQHSAVDALKALGGRYAAETYSDLWLMDVRLSADLSSGFEDEVGTYWTLALSGREMPSWQGPADGVIPSATPITFRSELVKPMELKIIDV